MLKEIAANLQVKTKQNKFFFSDSVDPINEGLQQGVGYCQKFCGERSFPNLVIGKPPNLFPKHLIEYQNVKIVASKLRKKKKKKHITTINFKRKQEKKTLMNITQNPT